MKEFLFFLLMIPSVLLVSFLIGSVLIKLRYWVEESDKRKKAAKIIIVIVTVLSLAGALTVGLL